MKRYRNKTLLNKTLLIALAILLVLGLAAMSEMANGGNSPPPPKAPEPTPTVCPDPGCYEPPYTAVTLRSFTAKRVR